MNCDKPAVALLTFAPPEAKAWLYDLEAPDPTGGIMLCRKHANATVVPMSWQLIDARDPAWPGPVGSQPVVQAMASASVEELMPSAPQSPQSPHAVEPVEPLAIDLPSDAAAIESEFAGLRSDLPVTPKQYAEPQLATARAAGRSATSDLVINVTNEPDPSLFELPLADVPAVTPHPGY